MCRQLLFGGSRSQLIAGLFDGPSQICQQTLQGAAWGMGWWALDGSTFEVPKAAVFVMSFLSKFHKVFECCWDWPWNVVQLVDSYIILYNIIYIYILYNIIYIYSTRFWPCPFDSTGTWLHLWLPYVGQVGASGPHDSTALRMAEHLDHLIVVHGGFRSASFSLLTFRNLKISSWSLERNIMTQVATTISASWVSYGALCPEHRIAAKALIWQLVGKRVHGRPMYPMAQYTVLAWLLLLLLLLNIKILHVELGSFPTKKTCCPQPPTGQAAVDFVPCCWEILEIQVVCPTMPVLSWICSAIQYELISVPLPSQLESTK